MKSSPPIRPTIIGVLTFLALASLVWWMSTPGALMPSVRFSKGGLPPEKSAPSVPAKTAQSPVARVALEKLLKSKPGQIDRISAQAALKQLIDDARTSPALVSDLLASGDTQLQLLAIRINLELHRSSFDRAFSAKIAGMQKIQLQAELSSWLWYEGFVKEHDWFMEECQRTAIGAPNQQWAKFLPLLIASSKGSTTDTTPAFEILEIARNIPLHIAQIIRASGAGLQKEVIETLADPTQSTDVRMLVLEAILRNPFPSIFEGLLSIIPRITDPGFAAYIALALGKLGYSADHIDAMTALNMGTSASVTPAVVARTAGAIAENGTRLQTLGSAVIQSPPTGNAANGAEILDLAMRLRNTNYVSAPTAELVLLRERLRTQAVNKRGLDLFRSLESEILRRANI